jgi:chemotaxis protein MotA
MSLSGQGHLLRYVADGYDLEVVRDSRDRGNFLMHLDEGSKIY